MIESTEKDNVKTITLPESETLPDMIIVKKEGEDSTGKYAVSFKYVLSNPAVFSID